MVNIELIAKVKEGDEESFKALFNTYKRKVYRTTYILLKNKQAAEDVLQETFLQVYLQLHKLSDPNAFESWLYKIAVHLCYKATKKLSKIDSVSIDENIGIMDSLEDYQVTETIIMKKETREELIRYIQSLPLKYNTVITLYYFGGFSIREISFITGSSEGTVKSRLFYAKRALKELLNQKAGNGIIDMQGGIACEI